jgi:hypothetical protein
VGQSINVWGIIKQVALNKSSLLPKIQKQSTQTLPLFTDIIKTGKNLHTLFKCQAADT